MANIGLLVHQWSRRFLFIFSFESVKLSISSFTIGQRFKWRLSLRVVQLGSFTIILALWFAEVDATLRVNNTSSINFLTILHSDLL